MTKLLDVYVHLVGWTLLGWLLGRLLPRAVPTWLGKFLFWIGIPVSMVTFIRRANLSPELWVAPVTAWVAILLGIGLALAFWRWRSPRILLPNAPVAPNQVRQCKGSFLLSAILGNTGFIGYPVSLALVGADYFGWTVFYDMGATFGSYSLGVAIAAHLGRSDGSTVSPAAQFGAAAKDLLLSPVTWGFLAGLASRQVALPDVVEQSLWRFAWGMVSLSLVLVGMRLSQFSILDRARSSVPSLSIKMLLVPLVLGLGLRLLGLEGAIHRALLLQIAMPPAFATLVLTEAYDLDRELTVSALAMGSVWLLVMLPIWLWLTSGG